MSDQMKVMATKPGVYGGAYRKPGDVFTIEPSQFSKRWMKEEDAAPVQAHNQEQEKAYRENAQAALTELGNELAGNPSAAGSTNSGLDALSDDELRARYEDVMGEKAHHNAGRATLIARMTEKLNAD